MARDANSRYISEGLLIRAKDWAISSRFRIWRSESDGDRSIAHRVAAAKLRDGFNYVATLLLSITLNGQFLQML